MKEEFDHIDNLFRDNLSHVQVPPSASVWSGISSKLSWNEFTSLNFSNFSSNIYLMGSSAAAGLTSIVIAASVIIGMQENREQPVDPALINPIPSKQIAIEKEPINTINDRTFVVQMDEAPVSPKASPVAKPLEEKLIENKIVQVEEEKPETDFEINLVSEEVVQERFGVPAFMKSKYPQGYMSNGLMSQMPAAWDFRLYDDYSKPSNISFGLKSGPEFIDVNSSQNTNISQINAGFFARYEFDGGMYLQAGAGISLMEDETPFVLDYKSLDSVGFYYDVHYYVPDPTNPDSVILITTIETIYDSVTHNEIAYTNNRYTYLRLPLMIGYEIVKYKNFGLNMQAGGEFALILNRTEPMAYIPSDVRLLNYERAIEEKLESNLRMILGLSLEYQLSDKLALQVEPTFKYYFRSVYNSPGENASSFSIFGGVRYHF